MKNFLLGALVFALLSFTAVETKLLTIKPATPKSIVVLSDYYFNINSKIESYSKKGYIVKTMVGNSSGITIIMVCFYT